MNISFMRHPSDGWMACINPGGKNKTIFRATLNGTYPELGVKISAQFNGPEIHGDFRISCEGEHSRHRSVSVVCSENPLFQMPVGHFAISDEYLLSNGVLEDLVYFAAPKGPPAIAVELEHMWCKYWQILILQEFLERSELTAISSLRGCQGLVFKLAGSNECQMVSPHLFRPADITWAEEPCTPAFACEYGSMYILGNVTGYPKMLISVKDFFATIPGQP